MNPDMKLVLTLRDPVARLVSDYFFSINFGKKDLPPIETMVMAPGGNISTSVPINRGIYHKHYQHWIAAFPKSQILIVDGENLKRNPAEEFSKVEDPGLKISFIFPIC